MDLKTLIQKANTTYNMALDTESSGELYKRMRLAGFRHEVPASATSKALDTILAFSDQLKRRPASKSAARTVYASLKKEVVADTDSSSCPRCKQEMQTVKLVGARTAGYCQGCSITLPMKQE